MLTKFRFFIAVSFFSLTLLGNFAVADDALTHLRKIGASPDNHKGYKAYSEFLVGQNQPEMAKYVELKAQRALEALYYFIGLPTESRRLLAPINVPFWKDAAEFAKSRWTLSNAIDAYEYRLREELKALRDAVYEAAGQPEVQTHSRDLDYELDHFRAGVPSGVIISDLSVFLKLWDSFVESHPSVTRLYLRVADRNFKAKWTPEKIRAFFADARLQRIDSLTLHFPGAVDAQIMSALREGVASCKHLKNLKQFRVRSQGANDGTLVADILGNQQAPAIRHVQYEVYSGGSEPTVFPELKNKIGRKTPFVLEVKRWSVDGNALIKNLNESGYPISGLVGRVHLENGAFAHLGQSLNKINFLDFDQSPFADRKNKALTPTDYQRIFSLPELQLLSLNGTAFSPKLFGLLRGSKAEKSLQSLRWNAFGSYEDEGTWFSGYSREEQAELLKLADKLEFAKLRVFSLGAMFYYAPDFRLTNQWYPKLNSLISPRANLDHFGDLNCALALSGSKVIRSDL